ncbi:hypothetical protein [Acidiphilium sp.]|uniref:hypothetical protein n=1 Tax=Acidiphilium sp. TaxID=527 RepID=UPI00258EDDAD|nr:hypothetical protein [Acidiphilium sp.]
MNPATRTGHVETSTGPVSIYAIPAALSAWSPASGAWTVIKMQAAYIPTTHRRLLPQLGAVRAGDTVAFPQPEAAALIAAGYATAVAGATATQSGVGSN